MPIIDVDLQEMELVDARVILTFTKLTSMLRRVIDESNTHSHEIDELKKQLKDERERADELEAMVKGKGDRRKSMADLSKLLDIIRDDMDELRGDMDRNRTTAQEGLKSRVEVLESTVDSHGVRLERDHKEHKEVGVRAIAGVKDLEERFAKLRLPELSPLEKRCSSLEDTARTNQTKIDCANYFVECWSANPAKLKSLCERQKGRTSRLNSNASSAADIDGSNNTPSDTAASGTTSPHRPGTAATTLVARGGGGAAVAPPAAAAVTTPYMRSDEDRTNYLLTLPPFQDVCTQYKACDEFQRAALESRFFSIGSSGGRGGGAGGDAGSKAELAKLQQELKTQGGAVRNGLDFMERRLKDGDGLLARMEATEEDCKSLHRLKADVALVDMKADRDAVIGVNRQISDVRDDMNDVLDRLVAGGGGGGNVNGGSSPRSIVDGATTTTTTTVASTPRSTMRAEGHDDLRRRVGALETEATRLETKKANREELQRFYHFLEAVDPEAVRRKSSASLLPGGGGGPLLAGRVNTASTNSPRNSPRSTSSNSGPRCPGGVHNGSGACTHQHGGGTLPDISGAQPSSFTPRRPGTVPAVEVRREVNSPKRPGTCNTCGHGNAGIGRTNSNLSCGSCGASSGGRAMSGCGSCGASPKRTSSNLSNNGGVMMVGGACGSCGASPRRTNSNLSNNGACGACGGMITTTTTTRRTNSTNSLTNNGGGGGGGMGGGACGSCGKVFANGACGSCGAIIGKSGTCGTCNGGEWEVRPTAATKGTPMRVFLGRSVATVRDSGGQCVPASIGSPEHYRYVSE